MNFLPSEILSGIFHHLNNDLLSLTTICRAFNDTISSDFKLSRKLLLTFRKLNSGDENSLGNRRRYEKLRVKFVKVSLHLPVIEAIGGEIVDLSFRNCTLKLDVIRRILLATIKVKSLSFDCVKLSDVPNKLKPPTPQIELKSLRCVQSDPRLFRVVMSCKTEKLAVSQSDIDGFFDFADLNRFVKLQSSLTDLELDGFTKTSLFADESLSGKLNFSLQSFAVTNSTFFKTIYLKSFAENQAKLLEKLKIRDVELCDFSSIVNCAVNLKTLEVSGASLNFLDELQNVEDLTIHGNKLSIKIADKFPCIKKLKLRHVKSKKLLEEFSENCQKIESLEVIEGSIDGLAMPTVKKLTLQSVAQVPANFFALHNRVENLRLENCSFVDDKILTRIAKSLRKLKLLTIINSETITNEGLKAIKSFCKELKAIKIEGKSESFNWKILESENKMKIYVS